jgi:hypothetical protein
VKMMNGVKMMAQVLSVTLPLFVSHVSQLISDLAQPLFEYYSVLAGQMSSLEPQAMSAARTSDTIMLAHIVFKVQSKMAVWLFPKTQKPQSELQALDPWVRAAASDTIVDSRRAAAPHLLPSRRRPASDAVRPEDKLSALATVERRGHTEHGLYDASHPCLWQAVPATSDRGQASLCNAARLHTPGSVLLGQGHRGVESLCGLHRW